MSLPHCPFDGPPVSTSHSEPEEVASDHEGDLEDQDELDDQKNKEQDESENRDREDYRVEVCTCEEGNLKTCWKCQPSSSITFVGDATVTANPEFCLVDCQVLSQPENIDEIVQDHDNFGTDENDDSLDSLALATGSSCSVLLYRQDSEDSAEDDPCIFGTSKRKNNGEADQAFDSEPIVKKKKKSSVNANCSVPALDRDNKQINIDLPVPLLDKNAKVIHPFFKVQQLQEFLSGDPSVEHEVCSPQHAPANCSTTATCSKQTPIEEEIEVLPAPPSAAIVSWVETFSRWSHTDKIVAIDQLITACHPLEVRHMMNVIEPQFQRDFIALLPKELALYVLSFLEPCDLLRAAQTCRYWRILAEDNLLWREKCQEAGLSNVLETLNLKRKKTSIGGFNHSNWKSGFMRQHNIEMNWRKMPIRSPGVLKGHDDHVITCLQFSGNRIVSGSDDNTLQVWNATTGKCLKTLVGHTGGVWSSQMEGSTIISGSTDRTLKVWNADTGDCVKTLHGHTSTVRCMHLHKNKVVSGSRDATLRMWDIISGECLHVLLGHVAAVRCVQYDGKLVVSGAYDYLVKVWNPETEECLHTLSGHTNRVYSLQFDGIHIVSGSLDTSIRVWDVETGACKHALMGHQSLTSGMELRDNILVSGNADSTVKVWDIATGQCLQTLSGPNKHQSAVTSLQFNSKFVITSSDDGTVKLWDVKTGDFLRDLVALDSGGSGGVVWRIRSSATKLVCAVGSRNGTEETKLLVLDFDVQDTK